MSLIKYLGEQREYGERSQRSNPVSTILEGLSTTIPSESLPVRAETSDWQTLLQPERLFKNFVFLKFDHLAYFINEVLRYQEYHQHHCIMTISHLSADIETYTLDVNRVTQQDLNLSKFCDEVYEDIRFLNLDRTDLE